MIVNESSLNRGFGSPLTVGDPPADPPLGDAIEDEKEEASLPLLLRPLHMDLPDDDMGVDWNDRPLDFHILTPLLLFLVLPLLLLFMLLLP